GWTQRGRMLGHWVGPGGQTQFISADWVVARSRVGLFAERARRNEDAFFREYLPYPNRHDVSLELGVRAATVKHDIEFAIDASIGKRINFEFQNATYLPNVRTVDIATPRLRIAVTPASQR
ncbi:MAG: capsule assembly Wzi family protein, partial [Gemmatimonadota bacterium]|nr:capsule assembly Wzi family protein [Gemmatimonadota bacterium]